MDLAILPYPPTAPPEDGEPTTTGVVVLGGMLGMVGGRTEEEKEVRDSRSRSRLGGGCWDGDWEFEGEDMVGVDGEGC
jgi:hypothetical protein